MDSKRRTGYLVRQSSEHAGLRASLSTVYNPFADGYARMSQNDPGSAFNLPLILLRQCRGGEFLCPAENGIVPRGTFSTRQEARTAIFEYVEGCYNRTRHHSTLGYLSSVEFEQRAAYSTTGVH
jgi:transposase InsO family protein